MNPRWHFHRHTSRTLRALKYTVWLLACGSCGVDTKYGGNEVSVSTEEAQQLGVWVQSLRPAKAGWAVRDTPVVALQ